MDNILINSLSEGLKDGGLEFITNFPGYMSHKLFEACGGIDPSVNEKIAYELAWGAALGGKRTASTFKNVGLNDAADPYINSMLLDVNAGFVLVIFDDTDVEGSQCRLDSRYYRDFYGGLWFEPNDIQSAYDIAYSSFEISEQLNIPIVIRITSQLVNMKGSFSRKKKSIRKTIQQDKTNKDYVVHPVNSDYQQKKLKEKQRAIQEYVDTNFNLEESSIESIIRLSFGCNLRELNGKNSIVQIITYPIPKKLSEFQNSNIEIYEQGAMYAYAKIKELFSTQEILSNTGIKPDNNHGYIISKNYRKLFEILNENQEWVKVGDLGEYTMDDLESINACLCFGSALSVASGISLTSDKEVFAITGDASFLHSGKNIIPEIIKRGIKITILIIDNGGSQGTGGQKIPGSISDSLKGIDYVTVDFKNIEQEILRNHIDTVLHSSKSTAIILEC